jgi:CRAL/TRIO domain
MYIGNLVLLCLFANFATSFSFWGVEFFTRHPTPNETTQQSIVWKAITDINKINIEDTLILFCSLKNDTTRSIILDARYFEYIYSNTNYPFVIDYISSIISKVVEKHDTVIFHANMQHVSLLQIYKHLDFIKQLVERMKTDFPDKLDMCYIYNMPHLFSVLFSIISFFIDKKTLDRVKRVD